MANKFKFHHEAAAVLAEHSTHHLTDRRATDETVRSALQAAAAALDRLASASRCLEAYARASEELLLIPGILAGLQERGASLTVEEQKSYSRSLCLIYCSILYIGSKIPNHARGEQ